MRLIDLSHPIAENMPLYPGTPAPRIQLLHSFERDGYREKQLLFTSHTGTHVDAPAHILEKAKTLDQLPLESFYGSGVVLDVQSYKGKRIPAKYLLQKSVRWQTVDFVLFFTGYDCHWGSDAYFADYPVLTLEAIDLLLKQPHLKGIGFDTISPDTMESTVYPIHHKILSSERIIIENLTNLKSLLGHSFTFSALPLPIQDADGMPVRAVAILDDED